MSAVREATLFYLALLAHALVFILSTWAITAALGGRAKAVHLGAPRVFRFKLAGSDIDLGLLPIVASVTLLGRGRADTYAGPGSFRRLGLARRLTILLGPWVLTLLVAVVCLGPARAFASFANAFHQVLFVLDTTPLVRGFLRVLRAEPWPSVVGVLCAKLTAMNLLPLAALAGGAALHEIAVTLKPPAKPEDEGPRAPWLIVSMLFVFLFIGGRFAYGLVRALLA
jgi:membrane-associated protease RseP (regulator of RpoE activity)